MINSADACFARFWSEGGALGQVEVPVLFEGQVGLHGFGECCAITQEVNGDVRGVEVAHMADQRVFFPELSRVTAVDQNLGWSWRQQGKKWSSFHRIMVIIHISSANNSFSVSQFRL